MRSRTSVSVLALVASLSFASFGLAANGSEPEAADGELLALLDRFAQAWNRHDVDALVSMMTEDGVYEASAGTAANGERFEGKAALGAAFQSIFDRFPDAHWGNARHFVSGNRGLSEWRFTGTTKDGVRVEVDGCDVFTFRDGKIAVKNSFRKNRS